MGVLDYISDNDFIIGLKSKSLKNEIILAKVNPGKTLLETITTVFGRIANVAPSLLEPGESLQIPKIDFNILHNYQELEDKLCLNNGLKDYSIIRAIQSIRFRLDEKGALLKSEAAIMLGGMPRNYIFNKPFLLCLREKGAKYPYFAMWVDNAELLLKE